MDKEVTSRETALRTEEGAAEVLLSRKTEATEEEKGEVPATLQDQDLAEEVQAELAEAVSVLDRTLTEERSVAIKTKLIKLQNKKGHPTHQTW